MAEPVSKSVAEEIRGHIGELDSTADLDGLRVVESLVARAYWKLWTDLPVEFVRKDRKRVPEHWKTLGTRGSPFDSRARLAVNPANALLNYLYALLEAETTLACTAAGLDPGIGVLHADRRM